MTHSTLSDAGAKPGQATKQPEAPLGEKVPNSTTREALEQTYRGEGLISYESLDDLKAEFS